MFFLSTARKFLRLEYRKVRLKDLAMSINNILLRCDAIVSGRNVQRFVRTCGHIFGVQMEAIVASEIFVNYYDAA
jgi:hypothetical protein